MESSIGQVIEDEQEISRGERKLGRDPCGTFNMNFLV